jgi:WD40 repeat protein
MQLEHIIGYGGQHQGTLHFHSQSESKVMIYSMGSSIVLEDPDDKHRQEFLRGHDADISCIALSPSGELIASGQVGSYTKSGQQAPVVVWDFAARASVYVLEGLTGKVSHLCFSPDGSFLAAAGTGSDGLVLVWEIRTGELICSKKR